MKPINPINSNIKTVLEYSRTLKVLETGKMNAIDFPNWELNFKPINLN